MMYDAQSSSRDAQSSSRDAHRHATCDADDHHHATHAALSVNHATHNHQHATRTALSRDAQASSRNTHHHPPPLIIIIIMKVKTVRSFVGGPSKAGVAQNCASTYALNFHEMSRLARPPGKGS
eukprot:1179748-Prorocentrum_minimum.AAC.1